MRYLARTAHPIEYRADHATLGLPEAAHRLLEAFYDHGSSTVAELVAHDVLDVEGVDYPDYYADLAEDRAPRGRAIQPRVPAGWRRGIDPAGGVQLVAQLQAGAERHGAQVRVGRRVQHLVRDLDGAVIGVEVRVGRRTELIGARRGVVFASGGFLHNETMTRAFLRGPVFGGGAVEGATGDFVDIGIQAGAQLGNMSHAWWDQVVVEVAVRVRETVRDVYSPFGDSMLMVNRYGKRVVNEKAPYNERGQVHFHWDAGRREYPNLLLFMLFDDHCARSIEPSRFRFPVPVPGEDVAPHVISAPTWPALTTAISERLGGLAAHTGALTLADGFLAELSSTLERFASMAACGRDLDFGRGETPIEQTWAQRARPGAATGAMHALSAVGPYHCVIVGPGALDTKGGPVIDERARVLSTSGAPIVGLFGAGNCIASPAGQAYWGPGGTIGLGLTFGAIAGRNAAAETPRSPG
jgi:hypothetical protein